jgi:Tat protein translocase TatB subunit
MFDIGGGELLLIGIVALIAIGPKELPTVLRTLGQWMGKLRRMASEFQNQFQEAVREAEMADLIMCSAAIGPAWKMGAATPRPGSIDGPAVVSGFILSFGRWEPHQFARPHVQHQNFGNARAAINSQITNTPNQITPVIVSAPRRQASSWWLFCLQVIAGRSIS